MTAKLHNDRIAIVGMGYVGLPLALQFCRSGVSVTGLDIDAVKVDSINRGESYIGHISSSEIAEVTGDGRLRATTDFAACRDVSAVLICVPTPLNDHHEPDISYVLDTGRAIAPHLPHGCLVVLESTTYPGTTDGELREVLEAGSGLKAGVGFHLAFSTEREDPGRTSSTVKTIPKVVGGLTPACRVRAAALYGRAVDRVVPVSSCRVAEATKLLENIFRPGLGGHCIPIDPFYLTWKAREFGQHTRFIELAGEINTAMPEHVVRVVSRALNDDSKPVRGSTVMLAGLAYKPNVDDERESPTYVIMKKLELLGATVLYNDPFVPVIRPTREHPEFAGRQSAPLTTRVDAVVIVTAHDEYRAFDWAALPCPVIDSRNAVTTRPKKYYRA